MRRRVCEQLRAAKDRAAYAPGMRISPARIESLEPHQVFVFGSNAQGSHGAGAARFAYERFGAEWGQGSGLQGQSYAIDTMSGLPVLEREIAAFLAFAAAHPSSSSWSRRSDAASPATRPQQWHPRSETRAPTWRCLSASRPSSET